MCELVLTLGRSHILSSHITIIVRNISTILPVIGAKIADNCWLSASKQIRISLQTKGYYMHLRAENNCTARFFPEQSFFGFIARNINMEFSPSNTIKVTLRPELPVAEKTLFYHWINFFVC